MLQLDIVSLATLLETSPIDGLSDPRIHFLATLFETSAIQDLLYHLSSLWSLYYKHPIDGQLDSNVHSLSTLLETCHAGARMNGQDTALLCGGRALARGTRKSW